MSKALLEKSNINVVSHIFEMLGQCRMVEMLADLCLTEHLSGLGQHLEMMVEQQLVANREVSRYMWCLARTDMAYAWTSSVVRR